MRFSEQVEALGVDRQKHFRNALFSGKPLRPKDDEWTLGDIIFLDGLLRQLLKQNDVPVSDDEFRTPLPQFFGDGGLTTPAA
jgi:hypothetical protein